MTEIKRIIGIILLAFLSVTGTAQKQDAGLWLEAGLEKRLTRSFSLNVSQEVRLNENMTQVGTTFSDIGLECKIRRWLSLAAHSRSIFRRGPDDRYTLRLGYYMDLNLKDKIGLVRLAGRFRIQSRFSDLSAEPASGSSDYYLRFRLLAKVDLHSLFEPYFSAEPFFQLNHKDGVMFTGIRFVGGVEYIISRMHRIDLYYLVQREYQMSDPGTEFVLGVKYLFLF